MECRCGISFIKEFFHHSKLRQAVWRGWGIVDKILVTKPVKSMVFFSSVQGYANVVCFSPFLLSLTHPITLTSYTSECFPFHVVQKHFHIWIVFLDAIEIAPQFIVGNMGKYDFFRLYVGVDDAAAFTIQ